MEVNDGVWCDADANLFGGSGKLAVVQVLKSDVVACSTADVRRIF